LLVQAESGREGTYGESRRPGEWVSERGKERGKRQSKRREREKREGKRRRTAAGDK
jgi:hypothetical protein